MKTVVETDTTTETAAGVPAAGVSDRKRAANRANSRKSTGPRTEAGRARARHNALKHGLRSELVVLPTEDPAGFEAILGTWFDDWRPPTDARRVLVERAAAGAWRLRRCVQLETDRLAGLGRDAVAAYDGRVEARIAEGRRLLASYPDQALEFFLAEHAGVEALIGLWDDLRDAADAPESWHDTNAHHVRLLNLLGHPRDADAGDADVEDAAMDSWRLLAWNNPDLAPESDAGDLTDAEADATAEALRGFIDDRLAALVEDLAGFPDPSLVRDRIAHAAAVDASPEGRALLRYEGQHDRSFRATLNQLIQLTRTGADLADTDTDTDTEADAPAPIRARADVDAPTEATEAVAPDEPAVSRAEAEAVATVEVAEAAQPVAPNEATEAAPADAPNEVTEATRPAATFAPNEATEAVAPSEATGAAEGARADAPNEATEAFAPIEDARAVMVFEGSGVPPAVPAPPRPAGRQAWGVFSGPTVAEESMDLDGSVTIVNRDESPLFTDDRDDRRDPRQTPADAIACIRTTKRRRRPAGP